MRRTMLLSLGLALTAAGGLAAQAPAKGSVDLGLFGRFASYPSTLDVDAGKGGGVRFGFHFGGGIAFEADYSLLSAKGKNGNSNGDAIDRPLRLRMAYHHALSDGLKVILGAGYTKEAFDPKLADVAHGSGLGLLLGFQKDFNQTLGARVEATYDKFGNGGFLGTKTGAIVGVDAGLNWFFGNSFAPKDADKDGVIDANDACPGTPAGERVDARGCVIPKDADGDGVVDANDACPGTPAGTAVDSRGCPLPKDADKDGVVDANDRCPNTPAGTTVDANGCPKDSDGDGVADNADRCANTPAGTPVDANGCPKDSDGDGVADNVDRCAGTPAGTQVDNTGCPLPDTDGDKVPDRDDKCPGTPAGMAVDANGCQKLFDAAAGQTTIVLQGVTFPAGSSRITLADRPILDRVAQALVANPTIKVEVGGHTDNSGARATNVRLSQARANAVRTYLISKGVDGSRITAAGYGPDQPKVPNTSAANRAQNRRVELKQIQ